MRNASVIFCLTARINQWSTMLIRKKFILVTKSTNFFLLQFSSRISTKHAHTIWNFFLPGHKYQYRVQHSPKTCYNNISLSFQKQTKMLHGSNAFNRLPLTGSQASTQKPVISGGSTEKKMTCRLSQRPGLLLDPPLNVRLSRGETNDSFANVAFYWILRWLTFNIVQLMSWNERTHNISECCSHWPSF